MRWDLAALLSLLWLFQEVEWHLLWGHGGVLRLSPVCAAPPVLTPHPFQCKGNFA